jgi:hypothetical protein
MARPGMTKKPCHGCGKENTGRGIDEVCYACRRKLEFAEETAEKFKHKATAFSLAWNSGGLPFVDHQHGLPHDEEIHVNKAFWQLIAAVAKNNIEGKNATRHWEQLTDKNKCELEQFFPGEGVSFDQVVAMVTRKQRNAFLRLHRQIVLLAKSAYALGYNDGSDMLTKLMKGEVTNEQINEEAKNNRG